MTAGVRRSMAAATLALAAVTLAARAGIETRTTESGLPSDRVTALAADPGGWLWVGTDRGLARFDGERFRVFAPADGRALEIAALAVDSRGTPWVGTVGAGLWRPAAGALEPAAGAAAFAGETVSALATTADGELWVAFGGGIARLANDRVVVRLGVAEGLPSTAVTALAVDSGGALWAAGPRGVARLEGGRFRRIDDRPARALAFRAGRPVAAGAERAVALDDGAVLIEARAADESAVLANALLADADGALWVGGERLARLPAGAGTLELDERWPRRVLALAADGAGGVWAGVDGGGLIHLVASGSGGAAAPPPAASLERRTADEHELAPGAPVPAGSGRLTLEFAAGGAVGGGEVEIRYRLVPRDAEWQSSGERREAVYGDLPAGDYRFEVAARRGRGPWGPAATLDFAVEPRWYERLPVRLALVAAVLAALAAAHRLRLAGLRRRQRELEAEVAARTAELARFNRDLAQRVGEQTVEIRETRDQAILTLARLAELRDGTTGEHLERIASFSRRLTEALADGPFGPLGAEFVEEIFRSSPLHDIGKVAIPDAILTKPGPLDAAERGVMESHTTIGGDTLRGVVERSPVHSFLEMGMAIAYAHHERWDGGGYPRRLAGEAIPLAARIVAIADAYDAITAPRPYKPGHAHDEAVRRILADAGTHFDPRVAEAFRRVHDDLDRIRRAHPTASN